MKNVYNKKSSCTSNESESEMSDLGLERRKLKEEELASSRCLNSEFFNKKKVTGSNKKDSKQLQLKLISLKRDCQIMKMRIGQNGLNNMLIQQKYFKIHGLKERVPKK